MIVQIETVGSERLTAAFVQVEHVFDNLSSVFEDIGPEVLSDIQRRIERHPGPPLAASTIKRKGHTRILRDTDAMYASFQRDAAANVFRIKPTEAEFGTSDFKAMFHQEGTGRMPRRTVIEITGEQEAKYARIAVDRLTKRIKEIGFNVA